MDACVRDLVGQLSRDGNLTAQQERDLASRRAELSREEWLKSPERRTLIERNLRLAIKMTCKYYATDFGDDATSLAYLALCRSADGYDPDRGYRFTTYVCNAIQYALYRDLRPLSRTIQVPAQIDTLMAKESVGCTSELTPRQAALLQQARRVAAVFGLHDDRYETTPELAVSEYDPSDSDEHNHRMEVLESLLGCLKPRHRKVIVLRYGLCGKEWHTLSQVGAMIGITRQRVQQIEREAIRLMQRAARREGVTA